MIGVCDERCERDAGYQAHRRAGEEPCELSKAAHRAYEAGVMRARRRDGKVDDAAQHRLGRAAVKWLRQNDPGILEVLAAEARVKLR